MSPGYFQAMRIPIRAAANSQSRTTNRAGTAIVNESFARQFFPARSDRQAHKPGFSTTEAQTPWREIVGVVNDNEHRRLKKPPAPAMLRSPTPTA